jgi:anti-anti-sigma regulatory factor
MIASGAATGAVAKRMSFETLCGYRGAKRVDSLAKVARLAGGHVTDGNDLDKPWNFHIEWQRLAANITVVRIAGDLRGDGASSLRRTLSGELTGTPELLVLDLSDIEQIDADGIDTLHSVAELADEDDIRFCLVISPKGSFRAGPKVVELTKTFQTFSSITEALDHLLGGVDLDAGYRDDQHRHGPIAHQKCSFHTLM